MCSAMRGFRRNLSQACPVTMHEADTETKCKRSSILIEQENESTFPVHILPEQTPQPDLEALPPVSSPGA